MLDATDKVIINTLQGGFPLSEKPYAEAASALGIEEGELMGRIERMLDSGTLTRFGPMFDAERLGGAFCLCAMSVPEARFEEVVSQINAHPEVAHNYERRHALNVWFVLATERPERIEQIIAQIETETGLTVYAFPKIEEFFIGFEVRA